MVGANGWFGWLGQIRCHGPRAPDHAPDRLRVEWLARSFRCPASASAFADPGQAQPLAGLGRCPVQPLRHGDDLRPLLGVRLAALDLAVDAQTFAIIIKEQTDIGGDAAIDLAGVLAEYARSRVLEIRDDDKAKDFFADVGIGMVRSWKDH